MALLIAQTLAWVEVPAPGASLVLRLRTALPLLTIAGGGAVVFLVLLRLFGGLEPDDRRRLLALNLPARDLLARVL